MIKKIKPNSFNEFEPHEIDRLIARAQRLLRGEASAGLGPLTSTFGPTWQKEVETLLGSENASLPFNFASARRNHRDPEWMQFVVACLVAEKAHEGQIQKSNSRPYVDHPRYVAAKFLHPKDKQIAILHDTLEGSNLTANHLRLMGFEEDVIEDVVRLTHDKNTAYLDYIRHVGISFRAGRVKMEDIKHNLRPERAVPQKNTPEEKFVLKQEAYQIALPYLQAIQDRKIEPGASIIEFLTTEPYEFLIGENTRPVAEWSQNETIQKAEHIYMIRQTLLRMSEVEAKNVAIFDSIVSRLIADDQLPPPQRPRMVFNTQPNHGAEKTVATAPSFSSESADPLPPHI
jgi:hypothetical protein